MEPKPVAKSPAPTPKSASTSKSSPSPAPGASGTAAEFKRYATVFSKEERKSGGFEAQEAKLTPGLVGVASGATVRAVQAATAAATAKAGPVPRVDPAISEISGTFASSLAFVEQRIPQMATRDDGIGRHFMSEARGDQQRYLAAHLAAVPIGPLWSAASAIGYLADQRYEGAMTFLEGAQLVSRDERGRATPDEDAIDAETATFADGAAQTSILKRIQVDGGGVGTAMTGLHHASNALGIAVAELRVGQLEDGLSALEDKQADAEHEEELLSASLDLAMAVGELVACPSPGTIVGAVRSLGDLLGLASGPSDLELKIEAQAKLIGDSKRSNAWRKLAGAVAGVGLARTELIGTFDALGGACDDTSTELMNVGRETDRNDMTRGQPLIERHTAIGANLGKILEAQRIEAAAHDAIGGVAPHLATASDAAFAAASFSHGDLALQTLEEPAYLAYRATHELVGLRDRLDARHASRLATMAGATKTIVGELSELTLTKEPPKMERK